MNLISWKQNLPLYRKMGCYSSLGTSEFWNQFLKLETCVKFQLDVDQKMNETLYRQKQPY